MAETIRWGILGAAKFARDKMGPAIHAARGAKLVALASSSPEKAQPFQEFAPGLRFHDSYAALLADPAVDAVYIPLPNHLHIPWALKAIEAGKHVLVEKPVGLSARDIDPLIAARDRSGRVVAEAYMIAHHPQWHHARQVMAEGGIGTLRHVEGVFTYNNPDRSNIRFDAGKGGGSLPDIGVYTIGATRFATGQEPLEIAHAALEMEAGVDLSARVSARFDGFTAHWLTAMDIHATQSVTFYGTEGRLHLPSPFNPPHMGEAQAVLIRGDDRRVTRWPAFRQYEAQVEAFGAAIRGDAEFGWTLEDARGTQTVIDMIYDAAAVRQNG